jgi:hypothetical protein
MQIFVRGKTEKGSVTAAGQQQHRPPEEESVESEHAPLKSKGRAAPIQAM